MKLVNLTPHVVNVRDINGRFHAIPPSGQVARVSTKRVEVTVNGLGPGQFDGDNRPWSITPKVAMHAVKRGEITGLPDPVFGTYYIVSALVREAVPVRTDIVSPGTLIRDEAGQPVGCDGLDGNWRL